MLLHLVDAAHDNLDEFIDVDVGGRNGLVNVVADRVHFMEDCHDELLVAGAEPVIDVDLFKIDLGEVGKGGEGHAGALCEESIFQRILVFKRLLVGDQVLAGNNHSIHYIALLYRGEDLVELGDSVRWDLCVFFGIHHEGLDPGPRARGDPGPEVGRAEARRELLFQGLNISAKVIFGAREQ